MQELDLYRIYFCEFEGKIVTAKIIAQTDKFLYAQLSNGKKIKEYNSSNLYNTKEELIRYIIERVGLNDIWSNAWSTLESNKVKNNTL